RRGAHAGADHRRLPGPGGAQRVYGGAGQQAPRPPPERPEGRFRRPRCGRSLCVRRRHGLQGLAAQPARHLCRAGELSGRPGVVAEEAASPAFRSRPHGGRYLQVKREGLTGMSIAIIGGTGLTSLPGLEITRREVVHTPYGEPSGPITHGRYSGKDVMFLARHGYGHTIPPHRVNYRANLWALNRLGVKRIIAVAAVGGITERMAPGVIAFPDQIIDYTWSRHHTFFEDNLTHVTHVDFSYPYDAELRAALIEGAKRAKIDFVDGGTYGATQGPRLETAAEIRRMRQD